MPRNSGNDIGAKFPRGGAETSIEAVSQQSAEVCYVGADRGPLGARQSHALQLQPVQSNGFTYTVRFRA